MQYNLSTRIICAEGVPSLFEAGARYFYEVGHYTERGEWVLHVVSGSIYLSRDQTQRAADNMIRAILAAHRRYAPKACTQARAEGGAA